MGLRVFAPKIDYLLLSRLLPIRVDKLILNEGEERLNGVFLCPLTATTAVDADAKIDVAVIYFGIECHLRRFPGVIFREI